MRHAIKLVEREVPAELAGGVRAGAVHQAAPGAVLLEIPGLARALVRDGEPVAVERASGARDADIGWLVEGPVQEIVDVMAGRFSLRAACVEIGGRAVALAGYGAAGKSTLAGQLALRGHRVLSDRVLRVESNGHPRAVPEGLELRLWPDAVERLGVNPGAGKPVRPGLPQRAFAFEAAGRTPLALVVILWLENGREGPRVVPLTGHDRLLAAQNPLAALLARPLELEVAHFLWATKVADALPAVRLGVGREYPNESELPTIIEGLVRR